MLTFRHLTHVLALHQYGSFRKAASSLNMSNPAFSRSIARAEEIVGQQLFDRQSEGVTPTLFGKLLIDRGRNLVEGRDDIIREFNLLQGLDSGEIVIAAGPFSAEISGHLAAARMFARHPALKIRMVTCRFLEATEKVLNREADLAYAETSDADQEYLETETIGYSRFVFFARPGHPLTRTQSVSREDFIPYPLVLSQLPERMVDKFPTPMRTESHGGVQFKVPPVDCLDTKMSRIYVSESDAVSVATLAQIRDDLDAGVFEVIPFWEDWMHMQYGFSYLKGRSLVPAARVFMEEARKIEKELAQNAESLWGKYYPL